MGLEAAASRSLWSELRQELVGSERSLAREVELRLTGLMSSPSHEVAHAKLGRYLQESRRLREANRLEEALVAILVGAEYYWRQHRPVRAAGLLLEAGDLFHLLGRHTASQRCLQAALTLAAEGRPDSWWKFDIMATAVLLTACLALVEDPSTLSGRLREIRETLPPRVLGRLRREDGYRVAITLRRAARRGDLTPLEALEVMPTRRASSEFTTLREYLTSLSERYALIRDGLTALRRLAQPEG